MTKNPSHPGHANLSPNRPATTGKPRPLGWSIGHPWLRKYDGEVRAGSPEMLPKELVDELV